MAVAKILVPLTGSRRDDVALRTAFAAARPFNAHVAALFVHPDAREAIPYAGVPLTPDVVQSLVDAAEEVARASSKAARAALAAAADESHVRILIGPDKSDAVTASYSERAGHFSSVLEEASLLCDLIVFPVIAHGDNPDVHDGFTRALIRTERPVLLSPEKAPTSIGRHIALGWDGGMAAARALTASLAFLKRAESVQIFCFRRRQRVIVDADAVKSFLALHGVSAKANSVDAGAQAVGELLLDHALRADSDLLVMGGYGHSRALESMFGGVTQHIVSQPRLPVLMMH